METKYQIIVGLILGIAIIFSMAIIQGTINKLEENKNNKENGDNAVTILLPSQPELKKDKYDFDHVSKVIKVVDGDTIYLENGIKIRLSIADTPEKKQTNWNEAKQFTTDLCFNKIAYIDVDEKQPTDKYNRTVAVVFCDGINLNKKLIDSGLARIYYEYCSKTEFIYLCSDEKENIKVEEYVHI